MAISKQPDGRWLVQCFPNGRNGRRIRKQFATKGEAIAYERYIKEQVEDKPWLGEKPDRRSLLDLVETWYRTHGVTLNDGAKRLAAMTFAYDAMGSPSATEFTAKIFAHYREQRISGKLPRSNRVKTVTARTVNLELTYFRAMFNELSRIDEWNGENPLSKIRPFKTHEQEMAFLSDEDITKLLAECKNCAAPHLLSVVTICLSTGARWSEAEGLSGGQVTRNMITFTKTKGKRNRSVPISNELYNSLPKAKGSSPLFSSCYSAFAYAIKRAEIELPAGQLSHVLRHTFASHFMMNGGNILVLQRILGHVDIKMTMRYAHFAPDHLNDAVAFNPLSKLTIRNGT